MNLTAIRQALANQIADNLAIQGTSYVPDSVEMVTAAVVPGDPYVDYLGQFGPGEQVGTINVDVVVVVPKNMDFDWQQKLDELVSAGSGSVVTAINSDRTLGGLAVDTTVETAHGWTGQTDINGVLYGSVRLRVSILPY